MCCTENNQAEKDNEYVEEQITRRKGEWERAQQTGRPTQEDCCTHGLEHINTFVNAVDLTTFIVTQQAMHNKINK